MGWRYFAAGLGRAESAGVGRGDGFAGAFGVAGVAGFAADAAGFGADEGFAAAAEFAAAGVGAADAAGPLVLDEGVAAARGSVEAVRGAAGAVDVRAGEAVRTGDCAGREVGAASATTGRLCACCVARA